MESWSRRSSRKGGDGLQARARPVVAGVLVAVGVLAFSVVRVEAQAPSPPAPPEEAAPEGVQEESPEPGSLLSKVSIHGYLSQAYAFSDGNQILGIPDQGTFDYRTAAILIRADISEDDVFSVQLSHERNGQSPLQETQEDVELDWAFYEHHFGKTAIKVGRVKAPFGLYNEVRDVGTVLPLYRPPRDFYGEGSFTTETVDGLVVSHRFDFSPAWSLRADVYGGNWSFVDTDGAESKVERTLGGQLFLDTPVPGLRFGLGFLRFDASAVPSRPATYWHDVHASVQASFGRVEGEAEYKATKADLQDGGSNLYDVKTWYARLGVHLTEKLTAHVQTERLEIGLAVPPVDLDYDREDVLALTYKLRSDLVVKGEYHWNEGYFIDGAVNVLGPKLKTDYGIVSLSTSF